MRVTHFLWALGIALAFTAASTASKAAATLFVECMTTERIKSRSIRQFARFLDSPTLLHFSGPNVGTGFITPDITVTGEDGEYCYATNLPGIEEGDVAVSVSDGHLIIEGEQIMEIRVGGNRKAIQAKPGQEPFQPTTRLLADADKDKMSTTFEEDILIVKVAKSVPVKAKRQKMPREKPRWIEFRSNHGYQRVRIGCACISIEPVLIEYRVQ